MWSKLVLAVVLVGVWMAGRPSAAEGISAEQVRQAIDRGVGYLKQQQHPDGHWDDFSLFETGVTSLCTLALIEAGVPIDDPHIQSSLSYLRKAKLSKTYTVALQTMVFCAAEPKKDLLLIQQNVRWIEGHQQRDPPGLKGAWSYGENASIGVDNSNSQFALLALHEAERVGVPISDQTWRLANAYWRSNQNPDGSWGYNPGNHNPLGSMTCAGISALVIAADKLQAGSATIDEEGRIHCCSTIEDDSDLRAGLNWMDRNFRPNINPGDIGTQHQYYYLYGVERVGRLTNRRFFGEHDWYREGSEFLVKYLNDRATNHWIGHGQGEDDPRIATSMALLFLSKGRRPVLISKLQHAPADDWNHHPNDLANLTRYVERRWERNLSWQIIDAKHASPDDLVQSPVLYISGQSRPKFSDEQVQHLREYIDRGGFIFAEACCGDGNFDEGFKDLMHRVFTEPEYQLRPLDAQHPVWTAEEAIDPAFAASHPLLGVDIGCRTSVVYCPADLGCYWELARVGREDRLLPDVRTRLDAARGIGINVLAYATNRDLRYKLDVPPPVLASDRTNPLERDKIYIAKVKHGGSWNIAPSALPTLTQFVGHHTQLGVSTEQQALNLTDPKLFQYHMIFMDGRGAFQLSEQERKQLREFIERGGLLFGDAVCSNDAFADSFRREMRLIFPDHPLEPVPANHAMLTEQYGGFDLKKVQRREPQRRVANGPMKAMVRDVAPELEGINLGDRYGVLFSRYDLSCALERHESLECPGYSRDDAARIGLNVILYSLHE